MRLDCKVDFVEWPELRFTAKREPQRKMQPSQKDGTVSFPEIEVNFTFLPSFCLFPSASNAGEHLWPRSFGLTLGLPQFSDLHNLRPADVNGTKCTDFLVLEIFLEDLLFASLQ